jgi:hypothetical protein
MREYICKSFQKEPLGRTNRFEEEGEAVWIFRFGPTRMPIT